ncbi:transcriptional regulator (plasmid) [Halarchaeum sp. CBA1220]|uniref:ribbon-helix-helix domain-containing protein n=1 Tax=Halarchaeum sp. CBA1220 TaxID=1853682 RepID=UPI000F3A8C98|nr:ribbon-helix-helix domain-containing protein [Halarchaeum sp. CBA1220]QLC35193.1 transcriptional regulator [Halarchaeum sp. CBA1220]
MVKSTVRFPEEVLDAVEELVERDLFTNRSEFQRFAVECILAQVDDDYEPQMLDYDELYSEVFPEETTDDPAGVPDAAPMEEEFLQTAARVRQFAMRGEIETAEELVDTRYSPADPRALLLEDFLAGYRD